MTEKEYWTERQELREKQANRTADEIQKQMELENLKALDGIQKSVDNLVNKYMLRTGLNYNEATKYLTGDDYKVWRATIPQYMKAVKDFETIDPLKAKQLQLELETLASRSRISRLESLKAQINMQLYQKAENETKILDDGLKDIYKRTYENIQNDFKTSGFNVNAKLDSKTIEDAVKFPWSGQSFSENLWGAKREELSRVITNEITQAFIQGVNVQTITKRVADKMGANRKDINRIVRTEVNNCNNQATLRAYKDDYLEKYEFLDSPDERECEECASLGGQVYNIRDAITGVNYPPMHPNCRCTTVPVVDKSWMDKLDSSLTDEENSGNTFNEIKDLYPDKLAGVRRGISMSAAEALTSSNPNYLKGREFQINCQTCVVAFEARIRGYDVVAGGNTQGSMSQELSRNTNKAWRNLKTGKRLDYITDRRPIVYTVAKFKKFLESTLENDARYTMQFEWKVRGKKRSAHIIHVAKENDELIFRDPQVGKEYSGKEINEYLNQIRFSMKSGNTLYVLTPELMRVDNAIIDENMAKGILKKGDKK